MDNMKEGTEELWTMLKALDQKLESISQKLETQTETVIDKTEELMEQAMEQAEESLKREVDLERIIPEIPQIQVEHQAEKKKSLLEKFWNG